MKREQFEVIRGSGNVYRDLENDNPDLKQFKAILAAEIIKAMDRERLWFPIDKECLPPHRCTSSRRTAARRWWQGP